MALKTSPYINPQVRWSNATQGNDFLHIIGSGGSVLGGIDSNGILQGSLANGGTGGGINFVSSLPTTCVPGVTQAVGLSVAPYGIYSCTAANTWTRNSSPVNALVPSDFGITFDGKGCYGTNVSWTSGSNPTVTINIANCPPFTPADTGKAAFGTNSSGGVMNCVNASATLPIGILTYISPTQASVAVTSGSATTTASGSFIWFTDDRAKWSVLDAAFQAFSGCPAVILPVGISPIPFGLFNTAPPSCGQLSNSGNQLTLIDNGAALIGQSSGTSLLLLPPDSNFSLCTGTGSSGGSIGCLFAAFPNLMNFGVTGGCNGLTGTNNKVIIAPSVQANFIENLTLTGFGSGDTGTLVGISYPFSNKNDGIYVDQFGSQTCRLSGQNVILSNSFCGDCKGIPLVLAGSGTIARTNNVYIGATQGTIGVEVNASSTWYSNQDQNYGSVGAGGTDIYVPNGGTAYIQNWTPGTASYGIVLGATAVVYAQNSIFKGTTHCKGTQGVSLTTGVFFDQGGNSCTGGGTTEGTLIPTCSSTNLAQSSCSVLTGSTNEKGVIRVTAGSTVSTSGTITLTFAGTFSGTTGSAPSCTFQYSNTGTGSWVNPTALVNGAASTTAVVVNWGAAAAVNGDTYDLVYNCIAT